MEKFLKQKRILVTGACGTIGQELVSQLLKRYAVTELVGLDNNESELFFLEQKFAEHSNAHFFLADVRDRAKLTRKMAGIDIVFHTAAFKHVILCERSPFEAVRTNIMGVQNVISAAYENGVERVIFTSSDKAVNPTNVMGTSKLMGERLMTAANNDGRGNGPLFASTRFGNVLGSRGSVMPIFHEQIRKGGPITLTDPQMSRFVMSIKEAVQLVIESANIARGGEVFITKMSAIRIKDLARIMIEELSPMFGRDPDSIKIENIGAKPGEKMYEELMSGEETRRAWELDQYFVVLPAFMSSSKKIIYNYGTLVSKSVIRPYHSDNEEVLHEDELRELLKKYGLLDKDTNGIFRPAERYWPD